MKNQIKGVLAAAVAALVISGCTADAASYKDNPYTLVYDGAITENVKGQVNIHPVTYESRGLKIAANVYTPANYDPSKSYAAIVVAHPNGGTKEQVSGQFAEILARHGYITIAFDAAFQGASGGEPRNLDVPSHRVEDIRAAADFISTYPGVDTKRLGLFGICGGGGYSLKAAQTDKRFVAVATLSMFDSGRVRRNGYMDNDIDHIQDRLKIAAEARAKTAAAGEITYLGDVSGLTDEQANALPTDLYREGFFYYCRDYAHPNSTFRYTADSLMDLMAFDAASHMELINQPLLMMAGSKADSLYMTEDAFSKATGTDNKELYLIDGATHIRTYYVPEYVKQEEAKLVEFFGKNL